MRQHRWSTALAGSILILVMGQTLLLRAQPAPKTPAQSSVPKTAPKADSPPATLTPEEAAAKEAKLAIRVQAIARTKELFDASTQLENNPFSIKIRTELAEAVWPYDETRARSRFREIFEDIDTARLPQRALTYPGGITLSTQKMQLRRDLLAAVARRDPALAEKFRLSIGKKDDKTSASPDAEAERDLMLAFAVQEAAREDADATANAFRETMREGISIVHALGLVRILRAHPELADVLFLEAVTLFPPRSSEAYKAVWLLSSYVMLSADVVPFNDLSRGAARRALIQKYLTVAAAAVAAKVQRAEAPRPDVPERDLGEEYYALGFLASLSMEFSPNLTEVFRVARQQLQPALPPQLLAEATYRKGLPRTAEQMLNAAEATADSKEKDRLYFQAALTAARAEEFDNALMIVAKINDTTRKQDAADQVRYQAATAYLSKNDLTSAYQHARQIDRGTMRAGIFMKLAEAFTARKEIDRAKSLIYEVRQVIDSAPNTPERAITLFLIAALLCKWRSVEDAFDTARLAVQGLNNSGTGKETMRPAHEMDPDAIVQTFSLLARFDFARAISEAVSISDKPVSMFAQSVVCQAALAVEPKAASVK